MGTITSRKRKDGTFGHTATIRLKRDGAIIHSESATFPRLALAKEWMRRRESELDVQRAQGKAFGRAMTLDAVVCWYCEGKEFRRTKAADMKRLRGYEIAKKPIDAIGQQDWIAHIRWRRENGAGKSTAMNDLVWARVALEAAEAELHVDVRLDELDKARKYLLNDGTIGASKQRDRRPTDDELERLDAYFADVDRGRSIPMRTMMWFAIHSARRQSEITRLLWVDYAPDTHTQIVRDLKHPKLKLGNHKVSKLTREAAEIIEQQPRDGELIFPYNPETVSSYFANACIILGIEDLHFHDLRHEATSRLFEAGYAIQEVMHFTLHTSWKTLQRYTHLSPTKLQLR